jgi:hypothetical protein
MSSIIHTDGDQTFADLLQNLDFHLGLGSCEYVLGSPHTVHRTIEEGQGHTAIRIIPPTVNERLQMLAVFHLGIVFFPKAAVAFRFR